MKNLDLNNYGVQEMNAREMRETEGGRFGGLGIGILISFLDNFDDFRAGLKMGLSM